MSDFLTVNFACDSPTGCLASINGRFVSDTTGDWGTLPAGFTGVPETGAPQNVTGSFQDPVTHAAVVIPANLTVFVASDVSEAPEAPEPYSIFLVGAGLMVLSLAGRYMAIRRRGLSS